jgi:zinc protease
MTRGLTGALITVVVAALMAASPAMGGDVGKHRLSNGVTVLTMPGEWNRIVAIAVMVDAGSRNDPAKLPGLAYLTNAMLVQGTTTRTAPEIAEIVDSAGLRLDVETSRDYAGIYVTAIDSEFDVALDVITDVLQRPSFDESRLLEAQRVAHENIEARQDDPFTTPVERAMEMIYGDHPYAHEPLGTVKGIERITAAHLVKFHADRYVGGNTVISIVGNFSEKHAIARLEELLSDYPNRPSEPAELPPVSMKESETVTIFKDVDESYVAMGFVGPPASHPDFPAFEVMDTLIGMGSGSRLERTLGETGAGLVGSVGSFCRCGQDVSALIVYASTDDPDEAVEGIEHELQVMATEPVSDEELVKARNVIVGRHVIGGQTNIVRAARIGSYELAGLGYDFADSLLKAVNRVDKDDILRVASEWLRKSATVVVKPGKSAPPAGRVRAGI